MNPIVIHFLGHLIVATAIPDDVVSADSYFLAGWYAAFAAVDVIALYFARDKQVATILIFSFAWSLSLACEQLMLMDYMQRNDWIVQIAIDSLLFCYFLYYLAKYQPQLRTGK